MQSNNKIPPIYLHGSPQEPTAPMRLKAGPLSMLFDTETAQLRSIHFDMPDGQHIEILRSVYAAVRDQNWGTFDPQVSGLCVETSPKGFSLKFQMLCSNSSDSFLWKGRLTGEASGKVCFEMAGEALSSFRRNRIGFCVLHPPELAGKPCTMEHVDNETTGNTSQESTFPHFISPDQPMKDLRSITHQVLPGVSAQVLMEGETFEMEDQRNWTDASFKTYCTPLEIPFPVEIAAGKKVCQTVTLMLTGFDKRTLFATVSQKKPSERRLTLNPNQSSLLPKIGLGMSSSIQKLSPKEIGRLAALHLSHLRVDLHLHEHSWQKECDLAVSTAKAIGAELEVAIFLSGNAKSELRQLQTYLTGERVPVAAWLIFHEEENTTSLEWVQLAKEMLEPIAALTSGKSCTQFVAGSYMNFAEFNRERPPVESVDAVCFPINPQVHAYDNVSLIETLPMQAAVVESAKQFCHDLPIRITPVTLRQRFNPAATGPSVTLDEEELPPQVDPRQLSLFGAAWTLGSLKHLAASGVHSTTYYETVGWRGVQETEQGSACNTSCREQFPSLPASVFPLYHVLADVGEFVGGESLACESSSPSEFEGLFLECSGQRRLILASYIGQEQVVLVTGLVQVSSSEHHGTAKLQQLDKQSIMEAVCSSELFRSRNAKSVVLNASCELVVSLPPHAILRIDF